MRDKLGRFVKGYCSSPETQFKKGQNIGDKHPLWNGGRYYKTIGYVMIYSPNHPNKDRDGYVREHRLVIEKHIGRYLTKEEIVHHINGIKDDNRIENLVVCKTDLEHKKFHIKYKQFNSNELPEPLILGDKISVKIDRYRTKICSKCHRCKKLFWKSTDLNKTKTYCSISCGVLEGRYGK